MISESLLRRAPAADGRILRDRVLSGFGVRLNARKRTFLIATSVSGKQFRMMLGYWPLMPVDEARSRAMDVLRLCRNGGEKLGLSSLQSYAEFEPHGTQVRRAVQALRELGHRGCSASAGENRVGFAFAAHGCPPDGIGGFWRL